MQHNRQFLQSESADAKDLWKRALSNSHHELSDCIENYQTATEKCLTVQLNGELSNSTENCTLQELFIMLREQAITLQKLYVSCYENCSTFQCCDLYKVIVSFGWKEVPVMILNKIKTSPNPKSILTETNTLKNIVIPGSV